MKPGLIEITLHRGLYWPGIVMRCFRDKGMTQPSDIEGWQPKMDARVAVDQAVRFSLPCEAGDAPSEVKILPMEAAATVALPVGVFGADLMFINQEGKPVGPYVRAEIIVKQVFTRDA